MADAAPPPPPRRRIIDTVAVEKLLDVVNADDLAARAKIKSRDFPELDGFNILPRDIDIVLFDVFSVDSFAACYAARDALGQGAMYVGIDRSTSFESLSMECDLYGKRVAMLGISFGVDDLHTLVYEAAAVVVLENHIGAMQGLQAQSYENLVSIIDPDMGAAAMAWNFFHGSGSPVPRLLRYIEDADLGRELLSGASAFADGFEVAFSLRPPHGELDSDHTCFVDMVKLINNQYAQVRSTIQFAIETGEDLAPVIEEEAQMASESYEVRTLRAFPAWRCVLMKVSEEPAGRIAERALQEIVRHISSDVANRCFAVAYKVRENGGVRAVVRSLEGGPHVNEIGFSFGGCGHPRQAFFTAASEHVWEELWAPAELILWDVPSSGPPCLALSRGDLVTVAQRGERFRESPFEEWSWGYRHGSNCADEEEGWIPTLAHTVFIATSSIPSSYEGVEELKEGDLLVAWAQHGEFFWASKCTSSVAAALDGAKAWYPADESLQPVRSSSIRELFGAVCGDLATAAAAA